MSLARPMLAGVAEITHRTLRDYAATYDIDAGRPACRHYAVLNLIRAASVAGWNVTLLDLRAGLRCSVCGHRGASISIVSDGRPYRVHLGDDLAHPAT